jgi:hypothetical protein
MENEVEASRVGVLAWDERADGGMTRFACKKVRKAALVLKPGTALILSTIE